MLGKILFIYKILNNKWKQYSCCGYSSLNKTDLDDIRNNSIIISHLQIKCYSLFGNCFNRSNINVTIYLHTYTIIFNIKLVYRYLTLKYTLCLIIRVKFNNSSPLL